MAAAPERWDLEVDLICVGSGLGGVGAAITAHDQGAEVVVLEKAPKLGGVCAYSGGEVFVPCNHLLQQAGLVDSRAAALAYLQFLAAGYADPVLQATLLDTAPVAVRYFAEHAGIRFKLVKDFPDYYYPRAPGTVATGRYLEVELFPGAALGPWQKQVYLSPHVPNGIDHDEMLAMGGLPAVARWDFALLGKRYAKDLRSFGPGMMASFIKAALLDRGIAAHVSTPARELVLSGGRVVGVRAERGGRDFFVRARRGVMLASGGYDWRPEVARSFEQLPEWHSMCQPTVEGDGLIMGSEIGAAIAGVPANNLGVCFGFHIPGEEHEGKPLWRASWEGGFPHAIWVNRAGQRFGDESFYREYVPKVRSWDGLSQTHPNFPPYLIFDGTFRAKYPLGTFLPMQELPAELVKQADTLSELAVALGVDPEGLSATVKRWNGFVAEGVDRDFGRGSYPWATMMTGDRSLPHPNLGPLDRPPYYGLQLHVTSIGCNAVGLKTNEHAQVMHVRQSPIPGLYAAGNAAAPLDIGAGYQSGLSNLRGLVWGYLGALHLSGKDARGAVRPQRSQAQDAV
jgi:3-oxosteroid 1-dehydrogenase